MQLRKMRIYIDKQDVNSTRCEQAHQIKNKERLQRARITLNTELEQLKLVRKPTPSGVDNDKLQENSDQYYRLLTEKLE